MPMSSTTGRRDTIVAPLSALNPDTLYSANEWIAGVAGGSVGVLGTLIQLELKQVGVDLKRNTKVIGGFRPIISVRFSNISAFFLGLEYC